MATNEKRVQGRYLNLVASNPANPASGALCRYGTMIGIAIVTGAGGLAFPIDFGPAVYTVSVKGQNASGNTPVAAGDVLYYTDGQAFLDKTVTGYAAGTALAAVTSGATTSIDVALGRYGAEGGADVPAGSITGAMLAANISITTTGQIRAGSPGILQNFSETVPADTSNAPAAAAWIGGVIRQVPTAARTLTTDTAANFDTAIPGVRNNDAFDCVVENNSAGAFAITIAAGVGVTLFPAAPVAIPQNKTALLRFVRTGVGAWNCYFLGGA